MHLLWYVWINYFWASLKGNGPEALIQTIVYAAIAMAVYPPLRKWAAGETHKLHDKLDAHHTELLEQAERHHKAHLAAIKRAKEKP